MPEVIKKDVSFREIHFNVFVNNEICCITGKKKEICNVLVLRK